ncbi:acetyl-CoA carboxylase carboxyltransferase subunit [bacterium (Candidatus Blackallbacteria) CG17_big_fil_post_rev_8_21_14_2_50_48_46]|uniref:Acetyl-CoA carboxylase carboxyltransferase subunit n=1 Tax=bacterium (Candidatus Blackallbacteria) CG17_big_fil_post_rev_8_21_14_2_50_48_46 TaxID=2014261 RepID=A0A2M7G6B1_9BACT|nr:MAG: acetyl-CoA carboxylase carboxyltransferase subunit [bacterium (Candidatus Blackallbacteria) CG18_big_fil_WC_8_21_14_2_50_49_26]PIW17564.1 MAG: acetyl-CoA carboxylase carboxyltransferase subunit [bacterium (Candidatus Blackallbacteria) CG17_big_fil_post_rev_8_21_14_2_50_48_46]PIW48419.1 MAG: acetyl-CoA carboxylase carboxyltransferase subunit [bacterium (Candidatus Blackallbacteria) CG13_big_fil_rev_8_21_14_2_50_49_14]
MRTLSSHPRKNSEAYQNNQEAWQEILFTFQDYQNQALWQGDEKYLNRHRQQGKLTARERVEGLLDPDSYFLELMPLAGLNQAQSTVGASMVAGIGRVSGRDCAINASVPTIRGGAMNAVTVQKGLRLDQIAEENKLPLLYLIESAGADLTHQAEIFNAGGAAFRNIARRSRQGIPSISIVFGSCTAGGAYIPGMSDLVIMVRNQAKAFLAGPPLVRMATGEKVDEESLGGAEMHARQSGLADAIANSEQEALLLAREAVETLFFQNTAFSPPQPAAPPLFPIEELLGLIPPDPRKPYDIRELLARILDGSAFAEFKPEYGETLVTGFGTIYGYPVGILANNGVLFSQSAEKGVHFIQLCNQRKIPLLFFQNITGFMVGREYEAGGIIKNGAKLINAISNSQVPAITFLVGASYGAGNYGMCGRSYQPRFLFAWPHARIAVMGPEQLAGVMTSVQREAALKAGKNLDEKKLAQMGERLHQQVLEESSIWYATSRIWDDGVVHPCDTRHVLGITLSTVYQAGIEGSEAYGVFRM